MPEDALPSVPGRKRIELIDAVRGVSILLMVIYHFHFDLYEYGLLSESLIFSDWLVALQTGFACLFILISGISCRFSHSNLRRGLIMLGCGLGITLITYVFGRIVHDDYLTVRFGILHFLGTATLIYALTRRALEKLGPLLPILCTVLAAVTFPLPQMNFKTDLFWVFGIHSASFFSSDYFPLLPYLFVYLLGTWLGGLIAAGRFPKWFYTCRCGVLAVIGRNTLWIYLAHQPLLMGLVWLLVQTGIL